MIRISRTGATIAAAAALLLAPVEALAQASAPASVQSPAAAARAAWPQASSDLQPDPAIRFGQLPNGMRYAIRRQTIPAGQGSLRLWIGAGALEESDAQQGLAHFLEHMAFNGSKGVKEGDMIRILERLGLAFGPDTNASTGFDETVYKLDLPRTNPETLDTSLMLLRETASELTIAPQSADRERGVVLSEERARDTPGYRIVKQRLAFLLKDQRLPERMPIGKVEVLKTAPASLVADFYRAYYRPEHAVLVAVGDFDPDQMEAKIRARFGDWRASAPAGAYPDLGAVKPRSTEARLVIEPGAPFSLQLAWMAPPDLSADSKAKERRQVIDQLGLAVLNRRFSALARGTDPPFIGAAGVKFDQNRSAEIALINVSAETDRWRPALAAADAEQRRIVRYGVRKDELDREIVEMRARLATAAQGAATRRPAELADEIVGSLNDQQVVTSPAQDLALFEEIVKGLTVGEVNAALQHAFAGGGPLLFAASPKPIEGGEATLLAALAESQKAAVAPPAAPAQIAWPYASFGTPGKVAERRNVEDLGAVFVRYANGVRLTVKPTKFRDKEVLLRVNVGHGFIDLPADRQATTWAGNAFIEGGLRKITSEDMERVLASKVYGARFGAGDDAFVLSGETRTQDLLTELQVLAGYVSDAGWRAEAFQRLKASGKTIHDQYEATDSGVLARDLGGVLHGGDRRWTFPSREEIAEAKVADLRAQVAPSLAKGSIEVVVVGDVKADEVIAAVGRTFGALPPRPAPQLAPAEARRTGFPAPNTEPQVLTHKGRADQAIGYIAWPTADIWADPQRAFATAVLGEVIRTRLTEQLREAEGATYSPSVAYSHSLTWTGWGYLAASVEVPPEKLPAFFDDVAKIAADLRASPISDDELARAKQPRLENILRARVTNQYWLSELSGAQADPRKLQLTRDIVADTEKVTAAELQQIARTFLRDETAFKLIVRPQGQ
ncbi:MAG TPA: insulinase family protein [Phenylobacterium sp.]|uniref:M16 family metallopeptidase n=1 Tax=Phenylobacterium sp. TaxID=1871053 RepID=UPI002B484A62|nr:insulinase family protein [Phenylobacterium sp.]HKR86745.1 insulinase family protein [Phenylobacterium sp.]